MKKISKFFTGVLTTILSINMICCAFNVSAADAPKKYTLDELLEMSGENFLKLDNAKNYYDEIKAETEGVYEYSDGTVAYNGISGNLYVNVLDSNLEKKYAANITENELTALLGNTAEYVMNSPIYAEYTQDAVLYEYMLWITCTEYAAERSYDVKPDISEADILNMAKFYYCVSQVIDIRYLPTGCVLDAAPNETVLAGDVNLDKCVDEADAVHMERALSGEFTFTDSQLKIADVNNDGKFDELDAKKLRNTIAYAVPKSVRAAKYGDVTDDGIINVSDVVYLNLFLLNAEKYPLSDAQKANSDCVKDFLIDSADSSILMNYLCEIISENQLAS